jgi:hypothetical protein
MQPILPLKGTPSVELIGIVANLRRSHTLYAHPDFLSFGIE